MVKLNVLFNLDYEIHGNGQGSPRKLMVEPRDRMLAQLDRYGAKLTIMADVAGILRFARYAVETGRDEFSYEAIPEQLRRAVRTGHDVQLRVPSGYLNATFEDPDGRLVEVPIYSESRRHPAFVSLNRLFGAPSPGAGRRGTRAARLVGSTGGRWASRAPRRGRRAPSRRGRPAAG